MDDLRVHWEPSAQAWGAEERRLWDALADQSLAGFHQSWSYGQAMQQLRVPCLRAALTLGPRSVQTGVGLPGQWVGGAQFIVHRLPWFSRFAFALGGPIWLPDTPVELQRKGIELLARTLPLRRPRFAFFTPPIDVYPPGRDAAAPHAFTGRHRLATGGSTVLLDLSLGEAERRAAQEGRWRNRLNAAERSGLKIKICGHRSGDYEWLVRAEAQQRRERRYIALPPGFVEEFQKASPKPSAALLTLSAEWERQRCAGMMFLIHGRTATYHLGWTDDKGREHSAHNLLLWQACRLLIERGVQRLDLGGVNTIANPGLARFKLGAGGQVVTWAGTYL